MGNRSEGLTVVRPFWREGSSTWRLASEESHDGSDVGLRVAEKAEMVTMVVPPGWLLRIYRILLSSL